MTITMYYTDGYVLSSHLFSYSPTSSLSLLLSCHSVLDFPVMEHGIKHCIKNRIVELVVDINF